MLTAPTVSAEFGIHVPDSDFPNTHKQEAVMTYPRRKHNIRLLLLMASAFCVPIWAWAQAAPGSDPIILVNAVNYLALPVGPVQPSEQIEHNTDIPSWLQAKIARFEAKAYVKLEGGSGTVYTEQDVISRQTGNALQRTCTTEVASNTLAPTVGPSGRYGPNTGGDQIAVLRGDVVTICK